MSTRRPGAPRAARRPVSASAARRTTAASVRGPAPAARPRSTEPPDSLADGSGITVTRRALALSALIVISLAMLVPTLNSYVAQRQQLARLQSQVSRQQTEVEQLQRQVDRWEDPAFVAAQARERLLYAMPGETQYRLTDTSGRDVPLTAKEQKAVESARGPWYAVLWGSVEGASRLDAPASGTGTDQPMPGTGTDQPTPGTGTGRPAPDQTNGHS